MKKFLLLLLVVPALFFAFAGCTENGTSGPTGGGSGDESEPFPFLGGMIDDFEDGDFNNMLDPFYNPWQKYAYGASVNDITAFVIKDYNGESLPLPAPAEPASVADSTNIKYLSITATLIPSSPYTNVLHTVGAVTKLGAGPVDLTSSNLEFYAWTTGNTGYGAVIVTITDDLGRKCYYGNEVGPWMNYYYAPYYNFNTVETADYDSQDVLSRAMFISFSILTYGDMPITPPEVSPPPPMPSSTDAQSVTLNLDNIYLGIYY